MTRRPNDHNGTPKTLTRRMPTTTARRARRTKRPRNHDGTTSTTTGRFERIELQNESFKPFFQPRAAEAHEEGDR
jgi:hypothetical protein